MEYDEMTSEEYENQISDKAEFEYDKMKDEKAEQYFNKIKTDTQQNFNKVVDLISELTDKKTDNYGKENLYLAIREYLATELKRLEESK